MGCTQFILAALDSTTVSTVSQVRIIIINHIWNVFPTVIFDKLILLIRVSILLIWCKNL
jgi:hypothetical protein